MKIEVKSIVTFTGEEYKAFNEVASILDELANGTAPISIISDSGLEIDLVTFFETFADIVDFVEKNMEE